MKSVVPPPMSTTRMRSPTLTCSRQFGLRFDPGVEGRLRLFEQDDVLIARLFRGVLA